MKTHGQSVAFGYNGFTPEYRTWHEMKKRCLNPHVKCFPNYGGRGIKVCERWLRFENFFADMGTKPDSTSIGRINNDGNYEPANCRWETAIQQGSNKRNNRLLEFEGKLQTVSEWARQKNIPMKVLSQRILRDKMPVHIALTRPHVPLGSRLESH